MMNCWVFRWHANYQAIIPSLLLQQSPWPIMSAGGISSIYLAGNYHTSGTGKYIFQIVLGGTILGCLETTLVFCFRLWLPLDKFLPQIRTMFQLLCFRQMSRASRMLDPCRVQVQRGDFAKPLELKLSGLPPVALRAKAWEKLRGLCCSSLRVFNSCCF